MNRTNRILSVAAAAAMMISLCACTEEKPATSGDFSAVESDIFEDVSSASSESDIPEGSRQLSFTSGSYGITATMLVPEYTGWEAVEKQRANSYQLFVSEGIGDDGWDVCLAVYIDALEVDDKRECVHNAENKPDKYKSYYMGEDAACFANDETFTKKISFYTDEDYLGGNPHVTVTISDNAVITKGVDHKETEELVKSIAKSMKITTGGADANGDSSAEAFYMNRSGKLVYPQSFVFEDQLIQTKMTIDSLSDTGNKEGWATFEKDSATIEACIWESDYTDTMYNGLAEREDYIYEKDTIAGYDAYFTTLHMGGGSTKLNYYFDVGGGRYFNAESEINEKDADTTQTRAFLEEYIKNAKFPTEDECLKSVASVE